MINVYLALLVLAHGLSLVVSRRHRAQPLQVVVGWDIAAFAAAVIAAPIVRLVVGQTGQLPFGPLNPSAIANTFLVQQYFTGATPTLGRSVPFPPTTLWATAAILLACCGWALMIAAVASRRIRATANRSNSLTLLTVTLPWILLPFVLLIGFSLTVTPIYTARYFSFTTPAVALLIGTSIASRSSRRNRVAIFVTIALLALPVFISQRGPTSKNDTDWQQAVAVLQAHATPGQDIYYGPIRAGSALSTSKLRDAYPAAVTGLHDITLKRTGAQNNALWDSQWPLTRARRTLQTTSTLWVVLEHYGVASPESTKPERYIEANGLRLTRAWRGPSTDVLLFTR